MKTRDTGFLWNLIYCMWRSFFIVFLSKKLSAEPKIVFWTESKKIVSELEFFFDQKTTGIFIPYYMTIY